MFVKVAYDGGSPLIKVTYSENDIYINANYQDTFVNIDYGSNESQSIKVTYDIYSPIINVGYENRVTYIKTNYDETYISLNYNVPSGGGIGTVTSVALQMPSAFNVTGSPITDSGTFVVSGDGNSSQYIDGTGSLQNFPTTLDSQDVIIEVRNNSGSTIPIGTVVYINGAVGNKPTIAKAIATTDGTSAQTLGLTMTAIDNNTQGFVVIIGRCENIDTSAFAEGTQLYLSGTVAGGYTSTKPYAPIHLVYVGIVTRSHPTLGVIEVKVQNGYEMDELHDVAAQSPNNGDVLQYVTSTGLWTKTSSIDFGSW